MFPDVAGILGGGLSVASTVRGGPKGLEGLCVGIKGVTRLIECKSTRY